MLHWQINDTIDVYSYSLHHRWRLRLTCQSVFSWDISVDNRLVVVWSDPETVSVYIITKAQKFTHLWWIRHDMTGTGRPCLSSVLFVFYLHTPGGVTVGQYWFLVALVLIPMDALCTRNDVFLHALSPLQHQLHCQTPRRPNCFLSFIWLGILYSSSPVLSCCIVVSFVSVVRSDYTGLSCLQVQCFHLNNTLLSQIYPSRPGDPQLTGRRTHTVVSMYNMFSL